MQGLIFVVDSNDRERVAESAEELSKMVSNCQEVELLLRAEDCQDIVIAPLFIRT